MKQPTRHFIAGALCPKCGSYDSLYFVDKTYESFACIDCQYHSSSINEQTPKPTTKLQDQAETQRIKIIETDKKSKL